MQKVILITLCLVSFFIEAQTLTQNRSVDWTLAGLRDTTTNNFQYIDMQTFGVVNDSLTPNDVMFSNALNSVSGVGAILVFPAGFFLFNSTLNLPSNIIIRGQGADSTTFVFDLRGNGNSFHILGNSSSLDTTCLTQMSIKDSLSIYVNNATIFSIGDYFQIIQQDADLVTSSWAENSVGQIIEIANIIGNKIILESPLRMDYTVARTPYIQKITPSKNVGIECLKILRIDDTSPQQKSNIYFKYAVNCWVSGIESENCTFSHIEASNSSNISISKSYFHHGFDYGGGGRAYGVMLQATSGECLVEDNIFEYLRHSMILQSGANGNVFAYNYSFDPFWTSTPNDAAGDMVLHGNYTYANLFEQNICRNIVIDDSHGPNGPYNTFFRNRAEGYGIFFSASNSPNQNFIGNDISNTNFPYDLVNYRILGTGHFLYGNNNKGVITPSGTNALPDLSYAYLIKPNFIIQTQWAAIGTPNVMSANNIPAFDRYNSNVIFSNSCSNIVTSINNKAIDIKNEISYPNPFNAKFSIAMKTSIVELKVYNVYGQLIETLDGNGNELLVNGEKWVNGIYFIDVLLSDGKRVVKRIVKT